MWRLGKIDFWWISFKFIKPLLFTAGVLFEFFLGWSLGVVIGMVATYIVYYLHKDIIKMYKDVYNEIMEIKR